MEENGAKKQLKAWTFYPRTIGIIKSNPELFSLENNKPLKLYIILVICINIKRTLITTLIMVN